MKPVGEGDRAGEQYVQTMSTSYLLGTMQLGKDARANSGACLRAASVLRLSSSGFHSVSGSMDMDLLSRGDMLAASRPWGTLRGRFPALKVLQSGRGIRLRASNADSTSSLPSAFLVLVPVSACKPCCGKYRKELWRSKDFARGSRQNACGM